MTGQDVSGASQRQTATVPPVVVWWWISVMMKWEVNDLQMVGGLIPVVVFQ